MSCAKSDYIKPNMLSGKTVFWDIDGTLAAFRFNGHICSPDEMHSSVTIDEIEDHIFLTRKPSKFMQRVIENSYAKKHVVIGHCICNTEIIDKHMWIDKHFPMIEERIFIPHTVSKAEKLIEYCNKKSIPTSKAVFVDDIIDYLREAESMGISSWHISSFLDYFE